MIPAWIELQKHLVGRTITEVAPANPREYGDADPVVLRFDDGSELRVCGDPFNDRSAGVVLEVVAESDSASRA